MFPCTWACSLPDARQSHLYQPVQQGWGDAWPLHVSCGICPNLGRHWVGFCRAAPRIRRVVSSFRRLFLPGVFFRFGQQTNAVFDYGVGYIPKFHVAVRFDDIFVCSVAFGLDWALQEGYEKIIVVRTRDRSYRKDPNHSSIAFLQKQLYGRKYPEFLNVWQQSAERYNVLCDRTDQLEKEGRIFVIAPSVPVTVGRLEKDIEKLGSLYWMGYHDAESDLASLLAYLKKNK